MLWFFRIFSRFRALEEQLRNFDADRDATIMQLRADLHRESTEKLVLQDRLDAAEAERQRLWERYDTAVSEERKAYAMQINAVWAKEHGTRPYPEAPSPERPLPQPAGEPVRRRMLPSEAIAIEAQSYIDRKIRSSQPTRG